MLLFALHLQLVEVTVGFKLNPNLIFIIYHPNYIHASNFNIFHKNPI